MLQSQRFCFFFHLIQNESRYETTQMQQTLQVIRHITVGFRKHNDSQNKTKKHARACVCARGARVCTCYRKQSAIIYNFPFSYSYILLVLNYVFPLITLTVTYTRVGIELWGSQAIGEQTSVQTIRVKSKRKVNTGLLNLPAPPLNVGSPFWVCLCWVCYLSRCC